MEGVRGSNSPHLGSTPDIIYLYIYIHTDISVLTFNSIFFLLFLTSRIFLWSKLHKSYYDSLFFNDQIFATVIFRCDMLLLLAPLGLTLLLVGCLWQYFLFLFSFLHHNPPPFYLVKLDNLLRILSDCDFEFLRLYLFCFLVKHFFPYNFYANVCNWKNLAELLH